MTPTYFYLDNVVYLQEKKQVALEFLSGSKRFCKRYSFFPFLYLPNEKEIVGFLLSLPKSKVSFTQTQIGFIEVMASDYETLLELTSSLKEKGFGEFEVLEPQTQFLLQKNWGFFDLFSIEKEEITKVNSFLHSIESEPLKSFFSGAFLELKKVSEKDAFLFLEKTCLSSILCIHPSKIISPDLSSLLLAKNWFFKNGFPLKKVFFENKVIEKPIGFVEFDFSQVINNFFCEKNLGVDTLNCDCCKPESFFENNVLSTSLVLVEFFVNGFYFEPKNKAFAKEFHEKNANKSQRLDYKAEWSLSNLPIGPFFKGEKIVLPFLEARFLQPSHAKVINVEKLFWHCTKKESFIFRELKDLFELKKILEKKIVVAQSKNIAASGVLFQLSTNFSFYFSSRFLNAVESILESFPTVFSTDFFSGDFSQSMGFAKSEVFSSFLEFSQKNGFFSPIVAKDSVFLKCDKPLLLAEAFSSETGLFRPKISFKQD